MDELSEFDKPVFKQLSHNDSGASSGNQAGFVIPQELDPYFPQLTEKITPENPSVSEAIRAILIVSGNEIGTVSANYQYQSWGGARKERRLTNNLGPLRSKSVAGDIVVIERSFVDRSLYRLTLVKKGTERHKAILRASSGKKWGVVDPLDPPMTDKQIDTAVAQQQKHESNPFSLFDNDAALTETRSMGIARSRAFQSLTSKYYDNKCAVCGMGFVTSSGKTEVEAAHIVPRGKKGADDARNGLALCRSHHWAFDRGLWGVNASGKIEISQAALGIGSNNSLQSFAGKVLKPPTPASMAPDAKAFAWHLDNVFGQV